MYSVKHEKTKIYKYKIRVNIFNPAFTTTPLYLSGWTKEEIAKKERNNPLRRLGKTTDIADTVLFVLSEAASYMTGQRINVNGGSML